MTPTIANIPLSEVPQEFIEKLDEIIPVGRKVPWKKILKPEDYKVVGRRGEVPGRVEDAFAFIMWTDEPGGYRIALAGVVPFSDENVREGFNEAIKAIEDSRRGILAGSA